MIHLRRVAIYVYFDPVSVVMREELLEILQRNGAVQPHRPNSRLILKEYIINKLSVHDCVQK